MYAKSQIRCRQPRKKQQINVEYLNVPLPTTSAVQFELLTARVLYRASCRLLVTQVIPIMAINYRVAQNKRAPGSSCKFVLRRYKLAITMPVMLQKSVSSRCNVQNSHFVFNAKYLVTVLHFLTSVSLVVENAQQFCTIYPSAASPCGPQVNFT